MPEPTDNLPVDEDTLAALIEGDLDPRVAEEVRERLLAADPALASEVEMMARDRVMLRSLGDERPPAGLGDAILARLEREALLGLSEGEGPIPISSVRSPRAGGGFRRVMTTPAGAGLAMAAVLAIAAGVTLQLVGGGTQPRPIDPLAIDQEAGGASLALERSPDGPSTRVAGDAPPAPAVTALARPEPAPAGPDPDALFTDDFARAASLLAEGRLLVRLRSSAPDETIRELDGLAARRAVAGEMWRLRAEVDEPVALALQAHFEPPAADGGPMVFASGNDAEPAERRDQARRVTALEGVYVADARLEPSALAALRAALSLGDGRHAVFEELREPVETGPVLTADAVLWWSRPPRDWTRRVFVPVVVERVDD